jgi:DNA/RNA endonuclease G (NUC1)
VSSSVHIATYGSLLIITTTTMITMRKELPTQTVLAKGVKSKAVKTQTKPTKKVVKKEVVKSVEKKPKTVKEVAEILFKPMTTRMAYKDYLSLLVEQARFAKAVSEVLDAKSKLEIKMIEKAGKTVSAWSYTLVKIQMELAGFN